MGLTLPTLSLGVALLGLTTACSLHDTYPPAVPDERTPLFTAASLPSAPPQTSCPPPPSPSTRPSLVPIEGEWDLWRVAAKPKLQCRGKGRQRRCTTVPASVVAQAQQQATVKPLGLHTAHGQSAMVRYRYQEGKLYEVYGAPDRPTYLQLPPGERLAALPALNTDAETSNAWVMAPLEQRKDFPDRQEVIALRPLGAGYETTSALLFQSGLSIFLKLVATAHTAMVSVSWEAPAPALTTKAPDVPLVPRPPKIDVERLHTGYQVRPQGSVPPPWLPVGVFDDGTRTYIKFKEALTYTRAPGVFGVTTQGTPALVQSQMYVVPDQPDRGAWLVVQGLWPRLDLKDTAGMTVQLVRQPGAQVAHQEAADAR